MSLGPLTLAGYVQTDGRFALDEDPFPGTDTFRLRRARFTLSGALSERFAWLVSAELTSVSVPIRDVYLNVRMAPWASVRVGQFVAPFSLERLTSTSRLEPIDRVLDLLTPGRDIGVSVVSERPVAGWFGYGLALVNGAGQNELDHNDAKDVVARVTAIPPLLKRVSFGLNAATGAQPSGRRDRFGADVEFRGGAVHAAAEFIRERWERGADASGFYLFVVHRVGAWETVGRMSRFERDSEGNLRLDLGGNYYFIGRSRLMANVVLFPTAPHPPLGFIVRVQLTL